MDRPRAVVLVRAALASAVVVVSATACGSSRGTSLHGGQQRVFPAGVLGIGSLVTCGSHGVRVEVRVPPPGDGVTRRAEGLHGDATVDVRARSDGSVVARCK